TLAVCTHYARIHCYLHSFPTRRSSDLEILTLNDRKIVIEGPVSSDTLKTYSFDDGLDAFRRPKDQLEAILEIADLDEGRIIIARDRKSTRLNSSHVSISYDVFCLKKKI